MEKKGLGRGLSALLADVSTEPARTNGPLPAGQRTVPIDRIRANPHQPRRSFDERELQDLAASIRTTLGLGTGRVSMLPLLELILPELLDEYDFQVMDDDEMPGAEGLTDLNRPVIRLPLSVYEQLRAGDNRARFTAAHEFGHALMHSAAHRHYARADHIRNETDPEWQANEFAAAFLMPADSFRSCRSVEEAQLRFGVGYRAAMKRARSLGHRFKLTQKKGREPMTRAR